MGASKLIFLFFLGIFLIQALGAEDLLEDIEDEIASKYRYKARPKVSARKRISPKKAPAKAGPSKFEKGMGYYQKAVGGAQKAAEMIEGKQEAKEALQDSCYLDSYGRGAGYPLTDCNANEEKNGALCYPRCRSGYRGVAFVCWQDCPSGFKDIGAFCQKSGTYGRGTGYALWSAKKCRKKHGSCEKWALMWYPKCKSGFKPVGCCICNRYCPSGMSDTGTGCTKKTYTRGAGTILKCKSHLEQGGLLCYPRCQKGYKGVGPVCWGKCPSGMTACGLFCLNGQTCTSKILSILQGVGELVMDVAAFVPGAQGLKGVSAASKASKIALKAGTKVAKLSLKQSAKATAKKFGKQALKEGKKRLIEGAKTGIKGAAQGMSGEEIRDEVLGAVIPGYSLGKEFVLPKCKAT